MLLAACGGGGADSSTSTQHGSIEIPTRWAYGNASDLRSLMRTSDEVFFGRVSRVLGQSEAEMSPEVNSGRQGPPLTNFEVTVTNAMTGTLAPGASVIIEQFGGTTAISGGAQVTVVLDGDRLLEDGVSYLFFADRKPNGHLTVPPFGRLQVAADGRLQPLPVWSDLGALRLLNGLSPAAAAAKLAAPE
jgi:hypothetical protein